MKQVMGLNLIHYRLPSPDVFFSFILMANFSATLDLISGFRLRWVVLKALAAELPRHHHANESSMSN